MSFEPLHDMSYDAILAENARLREQLRELGVRYAEAVAVQMELRGRLAALQHPQRQPPGSPLV